MSIYLCTLQSGRCPGPMPNFWMTCIFEAFKVHCLFSPTRYLYVRLCRNGYDELVCVDFGVYFLFISFVYSFLFLLLLPYRIFAISNWFYKPEELTLACWPAGAYPLKARSQKPTRNRARHMKHCLVCLQHTAESHASLNLTFAGFWPLQCKVPIRCGL